MPLYKILSNDELANYKLAPTPDQTRIYDALGRNAGSSNDNFFTKKGKSIENALGTTLATVAGGVDVARENQQNADRQKRFGDSMNDIYSAAGYSNADDYYNAKNAAERDAFGKIGFDIDDYWNKRAELSLNDPFGESDAVKALDRQYEAAKASLSGDDAANLARFNETQNRLQNQAAANADEARTAQQNWADYRNNSYIGQKTNQDRGKFLGSAMNTLSTAADVMLPGAGAAFNAGQGAWEGLADELEQNGLEGFDWGRAGQNMLTGAATGAITGALNKGVSNKLAQNGGNLFKGNNALTRGINNLGSNTALGRVGSTLATGAARGALSGAVGGATGAGLQSALNGQDIGTGISNAFQGAVQGAGQGALTGGAMAGMNMAANATPGVGNVMRKLNQAGDDWQNSGDNFAERWQNTRSEDTWGNRLLNNQVENVRAVGQGVRNVGKGLGTLVERGIDDLYDAAGYLTRGSRYATANGAPITNNMLADSDGQFMRSAAAAKRVGDEIQLDGPGLRINGEVDKDSIRQLRKDARSKIDADYRSGDSVGKLVMPNGEVASINNKAAKKLVSGNYDRLIRTAETIDDIPDLLKLSKLVNSEADTKGKHDFAEKWNEYVTERVRMSDGNLYDISHKVAESKDGNQTLYYQNQKRTPFRPVSDESPRAGDSNHIVSQNNKNVNTDLLTPKDLVDAYNAGNLSETELVNAWNTGNDEFRSGVNNYLDASDKWQNKYQRAVENMADQGVEKLLRSQELNPAVFSDPDSIEYQALKLATDRANSQGSSTTNTPEGYVQNVSTLDDTVRANDQDVNTIPGNIYEQYRASRAGHGNIEGANKYDKSLIKKADVYELSEMGLSADELAFVGHSDDYRDRSTGEYLPLDEIRNNIAENKAALAKRVKDQKAFDAENEARAKASEQYRLQKEQDLMDLAEKTGLSLDQIKAVDDGINSLDSLESRTQYLMDQQRLRREGGYDSNRNQSNRATTANMNGIYSAEDAAKLLGVSKDAIEAVLMPSEWHHVGSDATPTDFYDINELVDVGNKLYDWGDSHRFSDTDKQALNTYKELLNFNTATPETEVYRTLTGDTRNDNNSTSRTSNEYKLRQKRNEALLEQYGTLSRRVTQAVNPRETVGQIADAGFTKPQEVEAAVKYVTGSDGKLNVLNQKVIQNAKPVSTWEGVEPGQSLLDYVDEQIAVNGLYGTNDAKAIKSEIEAQLHRLPSYKDGSVDYTDSPEDVFSFIQNMEKHSANYKGKSGSNYSTSTPYKEQKAAVIDSVTQILKDRIYDSSDVSKVVTPEVISELKAQYPDNEKWAQWVDNTVATAKTGQDLRSAQAPFVRMGKILDETEANAGTFGQNVGKAVRTMALSNPLGMIVNGVDLLSNTDIGRRARAKGYDKLADRAANSSSGAETVSNATPDNIVNNVASVPTRETSSATNPATRIYDIIGRTEGEIQGNQARNANSLANVAQEAEVVNNNASAPVNSANTSVYNTLMGNTGAAATSGVSSNSVLQPTGDRWTDMVGNAMLAAAEAGDVAAFGQLYEMYQNALSNAKSNSAAKTAADLNSTQQTQLAKLDSADSAIDELESLYNNAGGGKGVIAGNLQSLAGDWGLDSNARTYNQMAEGLVNQVAQAIGKTDSLNTEGEVKRALSLIPQLTDDAQTAKNKLETLRRMLQTTKSSYNSAYGLV